MFAPEPVDQRHDGDSICHLPQCSCGFCFDIGDSIKPKRIEQGLDRATVADLAQGSSRVFPQIGVAALEQLQQWSHGPHGANLAEHLGSSASDRQVPVLKDLDERRDDRSSYRHQRVSRTSAYRWVCVSQGLDESLDLPVP